MNMNKTNKKVSTLAATVAVATAFCGLCAGVATTVKAEAAPANVQTSAAGSYKVILNPGWNFDGGQKKLNTIDDAGVTAASASTYYADNAYIANYSVGETLPTPTSGRSGMIFLGWRYSKDGELITVDKMPAATDGDVYLYANWKSDKISQGGGGGGSGGEDEPPDPNQKENGLYVGDTLVGKLSENKGASLTNGLVAEYWLGVGKKIKLSKDAEVSVYMGGSKISFSVIQSSAGIDKPEANKKVESVKVTTAGDFEIYLKDYGKGGANDWQCEFCGPTAINTGTEIPAGSSKISVTWGTHSMNFYLVDSDGNGVGSSDFSKYCLYTYTEEIFGIWAESTTKGVLKSSMTSTVTSNVTGWIFRWGDNYGMQTANITGLEDGGTYIIQLPKTNQAEATVTKLTV